MKARFLILLIVTFLFGLTSCFNGNNRESGLIKPSDVINNPESAEGDDDMESLPKIEFEKSEHDFGRVIEGEVVTYGFKFENTGHSDLLISNVSTSCGCTVSDYPKTAIRPGNEGVISITFNSMNRKGFQSKNILVLANTQPSKTQLVIKAMVIEPEKDN